MSSLIAFNLGIQHNDFSTTVIVSSNSFMDGVGLIGRRKVDFMVAVLDLE